MGRSTYVPIPADLPYEYAALCPLDGRYKDIAKAMAPYFSEYALMKTRVYVEIKWLWFLWQNGALTIQAEDGAEVDFSKIYGTIYGSFSTKSMLRIKEIEKKTNHDVKAVELFIAEELKKLGYGNLVSFVHIGCTSEDINNTAYASMIRSTLNKVWYPAANQLVKKLAKMAEQYAFTPMLGPYSWATRHADYSRQGACGVCIPFGRIS